jgi:hypothetical protein
MELVPDERSARAQRDGIKSLGAAVLVTLLLVAPDAIYVGQVSRTAITLRDALFFTAGIIALLSFFRRANRPGLRNGLAWAVLFAVVVASAIVNKRVFSVVEFVAFFGLPVLLGAYLGSDDALRTGALNGFCIGTVLLSLWSVAELVMQREVFPSRNGLGYRGSAIAHGLTKANAGFTWSLDLSLVLVMGFFILYAWTALRGTRFRLTLLVIVVAGIFATLERSPLVGLAAGLLFLVAMMNGPAARLRAVGVLLLVVGVFLFFPGSLGESFRSFLFSSVTSGSGQSGTISYRQQLFHLGTQAVKLHPLVGSSYGSVLSISSGPLASVFQSQGASLVDIACYPLAVMIEMGIIGFLALSWAAVAAVLRGVRGVIFGRRDLSIGLTAALVAGLVTSFGVAEGSGIPFLLMLLAFVASSASPVVRKAPSRLRMRVS